jgi:hypothetical protein
MIYFSRLPARLLKPPKAAPKPDLVEISAPKE